MNNTGRFWNPFEFAQALVGDGLQPVVLRDVDRTARFVAHLAQRREVVAGLRKIVLLAVRSRPKPEKQVFHS